MLLFLARNKNRNGKILLSLCYRVLEKIIELISLHDMKNTNRVTLLIDDNRVTNFFNKFILEKTGIFEHIIALENCSEALDFVNPKKNLNKMPDVIFLDLYTPLMTGWEFLEKYQKLDSSQWGSVVILHNEELLPEEQIKLNQYSFVKAKYNKSLNKEFLYELTKKLETKEEKLQFVS